MNGEPPTVLTIGLRTADGQELHTPAARAFTTRDLHRAGYNDTGRQRPETRPTVPALFSADLPARRVTGQLATTLKQHESMFRDGPAVLIMSARSQNARTSTTS